MITVVTGSWLAMMGVAGFCMVGSHRISPGTWGQGSSGHELTP